MAAATQTIKLAPNFCVGKPLPDADVVVVKGDDRPTVKMASLVSETVPTLINTVPAAFTKFCTIQLDSYKSLDPEKVKVVFVSTDKIPSLEVWKKEMGATNVQMVSDVDLNFALVTGLLEHSPKGLGSILHRATIVVEKDVIKEIHLEPQNAACEETNGCRFKQEKKE